MPNAEGRMPKASRARIPRFVTVLALGIWHLAFAGGCAKREAPAPLTLAAGPAGSAHDACARAIAGIMAEHAASLATTGGAVESLQALGRGRAELALTTVDTLAQAVNGEGPFEGNTVSARTIATIYTSRLHLVVLDSSPIHGFSQLRSHSVGLMLPGSGTGLTATRALAAALLDDKVTTRAITSAEGGEQLSAGRLDALFWLDGAPSPLIDRLGREQGRRLRLLNNASVVSLLRRRYGPTLYDPSEIPAGDYGMGARTDAVGVPTVLVSRHDLPADAGYQVTRSLFSGIARLIAGCPAARGLDEKLAARSTPAALHAGAARFYRESGIPPR